ncbi:MAG: hypothetical protein OEW79_01515 [Betaproteobacteria bacterium]|jgi:hypothetical protein|nr:hypothetical protein [Betaproteobacteria bacterium]MDH4293907.1 hypothetical protein [Betaproteobacteria bacterium]MDH5341491.1 hypothetical protein [Betaproteobacteria bacterium]
MLRKLFTIILLMTLSAGAAAQSATPSEFTLTPYLWSAGFKGTIGTTGGTGRVDADFSNLIDNMETRGFMLHADWRKDRWSVFGDWVIVKVDSSAPSPRGLLYTGVGGQIRGNILETAIGYRVLGDAVSGVDVFGGVRYYDLEARLDLNPGLLAGRSVSGSENWLDGIVGMRWMGKFGNRWTASAYGDVGAGGSNTTWQAAATVGYEFQWGSLLAGWRYLVADYDNNGLKIDAALGGPMVGASFRF